MRMPARTVIATDFSHTHNVGWVFPPQINIDFRDTWLGEGWNVGFATGPLYGDRRYHNYFYGVAPEFAAPPGVEAVRRHTAKGTTLLFLLNHRDEPVPISVAAGSRDLLGGSPVGADGIRLGPRDVVVLEEAGNLPAERPEAG